MERYKFTKIESDKKSKSLYYKSTYYPNIPISDSDIFIVTKYGDRLDALAAKFYQDSSLWWIIAQANGIKGFTSLYPNNFKGQLRIPTEIQDILTEFNSINGV